MSISFLLQTKNEFFQNISKETNEAYLLCLFLLNVCTVQL